MTCGVDGPREVDANTNETILLIVEARIAAAFCNAARAPAEAARTRAAFEAALRRLEDHRARSVRGILAKLEFAHEDGVPYIDFTASVTLDLMALASDVPNPRRQMVG